MHVIEHTYISLLADVARLSGFSEIRGSYEGLQWGLHVAPKLEKYILGCIEHGRKPELDGFPRSLQRLAAGSVRSPVLLRYLRQLLLFSYKASVTHDNTTTRSSIEGFLSTNSQVREFGNAFSRQSPRLLDSVRSIVQSILYRARETSLSPSHGPGASTTSKARWEHRYESIDYTYPYSDWFYLYHNREHLSQYDALEERTHIVARLHAVPKDTRGPRLICVHPAEAIWLQQGLRRELERAVRLERYQPGPWPHGRIQFDNQGCNGSIALHASRTRRYATLDMKEASDRISDVLVQTLFGRKYKYYGCCRAQKVEIAIPGVESGVHDLHCYAPMGNATTFPVQSIIFWAICVASLQHHGFHQPGAVFVFGDDIIVPTAAAEYVIDDLESFGLLVNKDKTFWRGAFRESCGMDAFNGERVTPLRWKTTLDAEHLTGLQALSELAMRLRMAGYEEAAISAYQSLRMRMRSQYNRDLFCTNNSDHGGIAEYTDNEYYVWRDAYWHRDIQWFVSPVVRLKGRDIRPEPRDWNHVLESVLSLERSAQGEVPTRPVLRQVKPVLGWTPIR